MVYISFWKNLNPDILRSFNNQVPSEGSISWSGKLSRLRPLDPHALSWLPLFSSLLCLPFVLVPWLPHRIKFRSSYSSHYWGFMAVCMAVCLRCSWDSERPPHRSRNWKAHDCFDLFIHRWIRYDCKLVVTSSGSILRSWRLDRWFSGHPEFGLLSERLLVTTLAQRLELSLL